MPMNDNEVYPVDTVIRIRKTNEFAKVRQHMFLKDGKYFLNYLVEIERKKGLYCAFHYNVDLECLPIEPNDKP
jgi:hypothetical protein